MTTEDKLEQNKKDWEEVHKLEAIAKELKDKIIKGCQKDLGLFAECHSGSGNLGYALEETKDGLIWEHVETVQKNPLISKEGIPARDWIGHITCMVNLLTFEQAQALAWERKAYAVAVNAKNYEIRVTPYHVQYDIKTKRRGDLIKELKEL